MPVPSPATHLPQITGVGLATPLGADLDETWAALRGGQFIRHHARVRGAPAGPERFFATAEQVAWEAVRRAGWDLAGDRSDAALVFGTSKGPIECWLPAGADVAADGVAPAGGSDRHQPPAGAGIGAAERRESLVWPGITRDGLLTGRWHHNDAADGLQAGKPAPQADLAPQPGGPHSFGLSDAATRLAGQLGIHGPRLTLSAACASGLHALIRAALMIRSGEAQRVLVVAAEASVHPLFLGSFQRLGVLPPEGVGCRPFDANRAGFLMSEAAAAVCLEAGDAEHASPRDPGGRRVCVDRYAFGGDAHHLTGSDPDAKLLRRLLADVIDGRPIDLVHAHGTGTPVNDPIELAAIDAALGPAVGPTPSLYSHKGALGHSLGAAGLVSVVLNWQASRTGFVLPNVRTENPLPAGRVSIARGEVARDVRRSIAVASGFGGPTAVVSLVTR